MVKRLGFLMAGVLVLATTTTPVFAQTTAAAPTFTKDVAPILYKNCAICHRTGEGAPMALLTYQDARPWAKAIRDKVRSREMPPWGADPAVGKYKNDRSLSQKEIDTIVAWVDAGAPKGEDKDLPPTPQFATGWANGRDPDAVIQLPLDVQLPAEGEIEVRNYYTTTPFKDDVFVKALEI